ncbi:MAG: hypothetical protein JW816_03430 [Candidatus Buchananbacteria bacterium]|nr:hypothetical protein [Candidatus Buchananbacteria bacterium]
MGIIKKFKEKKDRKNNELVVKNGVILFGLNFLLALALFILSASFYLLLDMFTFSDVVIIFIPLLIIFAFAAFSAVLWFRFGQYLVDEFSKKRIWYACFAVLLSVVLSIMALFILVYSFLAFNQGSFNGQIIFGGALFVTLLSVVFELPIVSLGIISGK